MRTESDGELGDLRGRWSRDLTGLFPPFFPADHPADVRTDKERAGVVSWHEGLVVAGAPSLLLQQSPPLTQESTLESLLLWRVPLPQSQPVQSTSSRIVLSS